MSNEICQTHFAGMRFHWFNLTNMLLFIYFVQQGGVLEPAVSAALDFKAMLEAALRGPSFPCTCIINLIHVVLMNGL